MSSNTMTYKGYVAAIQYSDEDGCFIGRILGIHDIVSFEGENVEDLRVDFRNAVDSYLATCAEIGKKPECQRSGKLLVRLPSELHYQLAVQAESSGESINSLVVDAVRSAYGRRVRGTPSDAPAKTKRVPPRKKTVTTKSR